jgi:hypothetical protein
MTHLPAVDFGVALFLHFAHQLFSLSLFILSATVLYRLIAMSVSEDVNGVEIILTRRQAFFFRRILMEEDGVIDVSPFCIRRIPLN